MKVDENLFMENKYTRAFNIVQSYLDGKTDGKFDRETCEVIQYSLLLDETNLNALRHLEKCLEHEKEKKKPHDLSLEENKWLLKNMRYLRKHPVCGEIIESLLLRHKKIYRSNKLAEVK